MAVSSLVGDLDPLLIVAQILNLPAVKLLTEIYRQGVDIPHVFDLEDMPPDDPIPIRVTPVSVHVEMLIAQKVMILPDT